MKRFSVIAVAVAAALLAAWGLLAAERDTPTVRGRALLAAAAAERDTPTVRGKFIRLIERRVGEKEYLGAVLAPLEGKHEVVVLFPRKSDLAGVVRRLDKGQKVGVRYVVEDGHKWAIRIEPIGREGEGEGQPTLERLAGQVRRLSERVEKLEHQVKQLRAENARLRKAVGLEAEPEKDRPEKAPGLPEGMHGFRGMLRGTVAAKGDRGFVLKVEKVLKTWKHNKARHPATAVGRKLKLVIGAEGRMAERHMAIFKKLKVGDRVVVEAFHAEGNVLKVIEELRKAE